MDKEKKLALKSIRETFLLFGHDTFNLTDEELEERIIEGSRTMAKVGYSTKDAAESITKALRQLKS